MDVLLLFLLRCGCHRAPVRLTTTEVGNTLGMSQQNVSRRLALLEAQGKITRGSRGIEFTGAGTAEMKGLLAELQNAFGAKIEIRGSIADGLGEGRFYLSRKGYRKQISEKLGFEPYSGTLNLQLSGSETEKKRRILQLEPVVIEGFREEGRTFGDLFAFPAKADGVDCAVVVPLRTHHGNDVIELAARVNLRKALGKSTGDLVVLRLG